MPSKKEILELSPVLQKYFTREKAFDEILNLQGKIFRKHKNRRTLRFEVNGIGFFVKIHRKIGLKEILKNISSLKLPVFGAGNELEAINKLTELGIDTMKIAGFGQRGPSPLWMESFLITEELTNTISLEALTKNWKINPPSFNLKLSLIKKVAGITRTMHKSGINHRDLYICHFLLDKTIPDWEEGKNIKLYIIDLHRVQMREKTPNRWIIKDLSGLLFSAMDAGITKKDVFRFMIEYSQKPLRIILKEDPCFWNKIYSKAIALYKKEFKRFPDFLFNPKKC